METSNAEQNSIPLIIILNKGASRTDGIDADGIRTGVYGDVCNFGQQMPGAVAAATLVMEDAVFNETIFSGSGRGRSAAFQRTMLGPVKGTDVQI
jgi:hypothetical protein